MTKEEERALLLKIEKALSAAEECGWVSTAFEGCVALAHQNIDNDWVCSPMDWKRNAEKLEEGLNRTKKEYAEYCNKTVQTIEELEFQVNAEKQFKAEYFDAYNRVEAERKKAETEVEALKAEVIRLKAKLFDMIEREEQK